MNPMYYDNVNKCKVIESLYYPEPKKQVQHNVVIPTVEEVAEEVIEEKPKKANKNIRKGVKFDEETINQTSTPVFSTYYLDQNLLQPNFFKKKVQSYYHENIPEQEMENMFEEELGTKLSDERKEKLLKDFQKAKEEYEKVLKKMRIAGLDECEREIIDEANGNDASKALKHTSKTCDVSAKESTYASMPDIKYCFGQNNVNSGYHYDKPTQVISKEVVPSSCISEDQYVYSDSQISIEESLTNVHQPAENVFSKNYKIIQSEYHNPGLNNYQGYY
uniref:Uncharacterized protein n=1 Tax=Strongyloides venezuelensis TaxID=75913 RepID=A0A0K0F0X6_STRVS